MNGWTATSSPPRSHFSEEDLITLDNANLDLPRIDAFIRLTRKVGGTISKLTLATAKWVHLFGNDEDAQFLIEGCAYGFTWPTESPKEFIIHN
jgi:hypothetical protein